MQGLRTRVGAPASHKVHGENADSDRLEGRVLLGPVRPITLVRIDTSWADQLENRL